MSNPLSDNPLEPNAEKQQLSITPMEETVAEKRKRSLVENLLISFAVFLWESFVAGATFVGQLAFVLVAGMFFLSAFIVAPITGVALIVDHQMYGVGGILIFIGFIAWGSMLRKEGKR